MKKIIWVLFALLLITAVRAEESDWFLNSEALDITSNIYGEFEIKQTDSDYNIQYIKANVTFFPKDSLYQQVSQIAGEPDYTENKDYILFNWDDPSIGTKDFDLNFDLRTYSFSPEIKTKINFPLENKISETYQIYLESTEKINAHDEDIIKISSQIVSGEDDLFLAELKLAEWIKININYSLDSITEKASKSASWVLENERGVCDELTNLFIAMNRALGIPTRYVSGLSYTNYDDLNDFSGHAWAEVYFPGYGWVPFDITYGEFGFVDAGHIMLAYNVDSDKSSINYQWKSHGINIETKPLNITAKIKKKVSETQDPILIKLVPIKEYVGINSYNLIEAEIENTKNSYLATDLTVSKSNGYTIWDNTNKIIVLKPYEIKKVYWIVKVEENLEQNYIYTMPISVKSSRDVKAETEFIAQDGEIVYTLEEINSLIEVVEEQKEDSQNIELKCITNKEYYLWEGVNINCTINNIGNIFLEDLNLCIKSRCRQFDLGITQEKEFDFIFSDLRSGKKEFFIKIDNEEVSKTKSISFTILDPPGINIETINIPAKVNYDDAFEIEILLKKKSISNPINVNILLQPINQEWSIEEMDKDSRYIINLKGKDLTQEENKFNIKVNFEDKRDNKYSINKEFSINLENLTFTQKIRIFLNKIISFFN